MLLKLEALQDEAIQQGAGAEGAGGRAMSDDGAAPRRWSCCESRELLERILADFERCGVVGEETNKLVGYLAAVSRKLERAAGDRDPVAQSAAGKSSLMDAVLALVPEEERVKYSAMTGQCLFYMGETDLKHKILAIVEEEGAQPRDATR